MQRWESIPSYNLYFADFKLYMLFMFHNLREGEHIDDPVGVGISVGSWYHTLLSSQYLVNQWLDSYKISMGI